MSWREWIFMNSHARTCLVNTLQRYRDPFSYIHGHHWSPYTHTHKYISVDNIVASFRQVRVSLSRHDVCGLLRSHDLCLHVCLCGALALLSTKKNIYNKKGWQCLWSLGGTCQNVRSNTDFWGVCKEPKYGN